jgi:hypothetical protein
MGFKEKDITEELERRMLVLKWLTENNVNDYEDVTKIITAYYTYPQETLDMMMA